MAVTKVFVEGAPEEVYTVEALVTDRVMARGWEFDEDSLALIDTDGERHNLIRIDEDRLGDDEDRVVYDDATEDAALDALDRLARRRMESEGWVDVVFELDAEPGPHYQISGGRHNLTRLDADRLAAFDGIATDPDLTVEEGGETDGGGYRTVTYASDDAREHAVVAADILDRVYARDLTDLLRLRLRPEGKVCVLG